MRTICVPIFNERMDTASSLGKALRALELLQLRPGLSGQALAEQLEISPRAVRRLIANLRAGGFTITSAPGPGGGYRVERGPRTPLVLTEEELTAVAMLFMQNAQTTTGQAARSAAAKVLRALPTRAVDVARPVFATVTAVEQAKNNAPSPAIVLQLATAIDRRVRIEMRYQPVAGGTADLRLVEPWGLVVRQHRWYLLGCNTAQGQTRTYRIDRITEIRATDSEFSPPSDLDAAAVFTEHLRTSWKHPTRVDIGAPLATASRWLPTTMGTLTATSPTTCQLTGRTNNCQAYITDLLQTPFTCTVRGGAQLLAAAQAVHSRLRIDLG